MRKTYKIVMAQKWVSTYNVGWQMTQKSGNEFEKVWENKTKKKEKWGYQKGGGWDVQGVYVRLSLISWPRLSVVGVGKAKAKRQSRSVVLKFRRLTVTGRQTHVDDLSSRTDPVLLQRPKVLARSSIGPRHGTVGHSNLRESFVLFVYNFRQTTGW